MENHDLELALVTEELIIEELEDRSALEVHGACACSCSCDCTSCSCVGWLA